MQHDVQQALDETARLAQLIYPPLLEAAASLQQLRAAAAAPAVRTIRGRPSRVNTRPKSQRRSTGAASKRSSVVRHRGAGDCDRERRRRSHRLRDRRGRALSEAGLERLDTRPRRGARRPAYGRAAARSRSPHLRLVPAVSIALATFGQVEDHGLYSLVDGRLPGEPELEKIEWITFSTDRSVRNSALAIAALFFPSAISRSTSRSRGVSCSAATLRCGRSLRPVPRRPSGRSPTRPLRRRGSRRRAARDPSPAL